MVALLPVSTSISFAVSLIPLQTLSSRSAECTHQALYRRKSIRTPRVSLPSDLHRACLSRSTVRPPRASTTSKPRSEPFSSTNRSLSRSRAPPYSLTPPRICTPFPLSLTSSPTTESTRCLAASMCPSAWACRWGGCLVVPVCVCGVCVCACVRVCACVLSLCCLVVLWCGRSCPYRWLSSLSCTNLLSPPPLSPPPLSLSLVHHPTSLHLSLFRSAFPQNSWRARCHQCRCGVRHLGWVRLRARLLRLLHCEGETDRGQAPAATQAGRHRKAHTQTQIRTERQAPRAENTHQELAALVLLCLFCVNTHTSARTHTHTHTHARTHTAPRVFLSASHVVSSLCTCSYHSAIIPSPPSPSLPPLPSQRGRHPALLVVLSLLGLHQLPAGARRHHHPAQGVRRQPAAARWGVRVLGWVCSVQRVCMVRV